MAGTPPKKKKVLVADDDPSILRLVELMLTRHGLAVVTAKDGEEAFEKAVLEAPDAILLDIKMPKLDGMALCSKLKATETTAKIPVAFITAQKDVEFYREAQELGAILYITKPFKPEKLIDAVGLLLSSRGQAAKL